MGFIGIKIFIKAHDFMNQILFSSSMKFFIQNGKKNFMDFSSNLSIVRSCNHYALFVIIAQILQNLTFPLCMAIIKTQNQCSYVLP